MTRILSKDNIMKGQGSKGHTLRRGGLVDYVPIAYDKLVVGHHQVHSVPLVPAKGAT